MVIDESSPIAAVSIVVEFGKPLGPFFSAAFSAAISEWFQISVGRAIWLKVGDIEVEANNQVGLEQLERAIDFRKRQTNAADHE